MRTGTGAANVIPGSVEVDFNFRFSTESTDASLKQRLEGILKKHALEYRITWTLGAKPFLSARGVLAQTVMKAGKKHTGRSAELSTTGGTSDARFIIEICPEVIELGPVNASIHKLNEHIALDELEVLPRIYLDTLRALLP
jgi:succinyl-diaminopimelate desuccinylase